jgi:hypothetical protein
LPRLQKLIDQYKNRPNVLFLSFNIDQNPGFIGPFMQQHKLSFTVLPAYSYATDTLKVAGIPQNWIVDSTGVVRLKGVGYDESTQWVNEMANAIKKFTPTALARATESGNGK